MLIINTYHKRLTFPSLDFSIDSNKIRKVTNEQFNVLINNYWIREVIKEKTSKRSKKRINN